MGNPRYSNGHARRTLAHWLKLQQRGCWICRAFGLPARIDYEAHHLDARAFTVDELTPVSKGGDPLDRGNVDSAHRACNTWRGNRSVEEVKRLAVAYRHGALRSDMCPPFARCAPAYAQQLKAKEQRVTSRVW